MTYKTSLLHLQPRQMTVTLANNYSVYCQQTVVDASTTTSNVIQVKESLHRSSSMLQTSSNISEIYPHLSTSNSNQQTTLSRSDPTLNQTTIFTDHQTVAQSDDEEVEEKEGQAEIESISSEEEIIENQPTRIPIESKKNLSPKHRLLLCTSGTRDSASVSETEGVEDQESSFYVMQNRPP